MCSFCLPCVYKLPERRCPECGVAWERNEDLKRNYGLERLVHEVITFPEALSAAAADEQKKATERAEKEGEEARAAAAAAALEQAEQCTARKAEGDTKRAAQQGEGVAQRRENQGADEAAKVREARKVAKAVKIDKRRAEKRKADGAKKVRAREAVPACETKDPGRQQQWNPYRQPRTNTRTQPHARAAMHARTHRHPHTRAPQGRGHHRWASGGIGCFWNP